MTEIVWFRVEAQRWPADLDAAVWSKRDGPLLTSPFAELLTGEGLGSREFERSDLPRGRLWPRGRCGRGPFLFNELPKEDRRVALRLGPRYKRRMSSAHLRYLLLEQGVGAGIVNFAINAVIAWVMFRDVSAVPLWGEQSIAGDTVGTCFFLPFLTGLIVTPLARGRIRAGKLEALGWNRHSHPALGWLPRGTTWRALTLGAICMLLVGPVAVAALSLFGVASLRLWPFVLSKATFAAALAVVVTPIISMWAIAELQPERQS